MGRAFPKTIIFLNPYKGVIVYWGLLFGPPPIFANSHMPWTRWVSISEPSPRRNIPWTQSEAYMGIVPKYPEYRFLRYGSDDNVGSNFSLMTCWDQQYRPTSTWALPGLPYEATWSRCVRWRCIGRRGHQWILSRSRVVMVFTSSVVTLQNASWGETLLRIEGAPNNGSTKDEAGKTIHNTGRSSQTESSAEPLAKQTVVLEAHLWKVN